MNTAQLPSNHRFGVLFVVIFSCLVGYGVYKQWAGHLVWLAATATVLTTTATIFAPNMLTPFNRAWFCLGELLGKIVSPIVLGIIFFFVLTPVGQISRLFGRDELRLKQRQVDSYWIDRTPPGPAPDSFKNSF